MAKEAFSMKEMVLEMREDIKALKEIIPEHKENTAFRRRVMNAIVGTAFLALAALGLAVLKVVGILKI